MFKKNIKFTDYDGVAREQDFYFNISKAELLKMEMSKVGGIQKNLEAIMNSRDTAQVYGLFTEIILMSYGEKSLDGMRFEKSREKSEAFSQTEAFSELMMELISDANKASEFIERVLPQDLINETVKQISQKQE